jgi:hypothetical protein
VSYYHDDSTTKVVPVTSQKSNHVVTIDDFYYLDLFS